jgi:hypothetical protein
VTVAVGRGSHRLGRKALVIGVPGRQLTTIARRISWLRLRRDRHTIVLVAAGCAFVSAVLGLWPGVSWIPGFWRGLAAGVADSTIVAFAAYFVILSDASRAWRVGALGEFWTSHELEKLGPEWTILNTLQIPTADGSEREVDHIAIGPGGVLVVDSKLWPSKARRIDASSSPAINDAASGANTQAAVVRWFLGALAPPDAVKPTVMVWGSDLLSPPERVVSNKQGVCIVHGRDADAWLQTVGATTCLDATAIMVLVEKFKTHLVVKQRWRDARPPSDWIRPPSR